MSWKYINVVYWCLYLPCHVSLVQCQLTLVTRDGIDSFRIGEGSCKENASICATTEVFCQTPTGLCQCKATSPHFRNPTIELSDGAFRYGSSYGCVTQELIVHQRIDKERCKMTPYQVIPYNQNDPVKQFDQTEGYFECLFLKAEVKYPDSNTWQEMSWLNESYVTIVMRHNQLHFKWAKSVPELQGVIIEIALNCSKFVKTHTTECLRANVFGTWTLPATPTTASPHTTKRTTPTPTPTVVSVSELHSTSSKAPTSKTPTSKPRSRTTLSASMDDCKHWKRVAIAMCVVAVVLLILLLVVFAIGVKRIQQLKSTPRSVREQTQNTRAHVNEVDDSYQYPNFETQVYTDLQRRDNGDNEHVYQGLNQPLPTPSTTPSAVAT